MAYVQARAGGAGIDSPRIPSSMIPVRRGQMALPESSQILPPVLRRDIPVTGPYFPINYLLYPGQVHCTI